MGTATFHPSWWNEQQHGGAWQRVKEAMRRDWEQTKNDVGAQAPDLDQNVADTVKQAAGKAPIPPPNQKTPAGPSAKFDEVEGALSYGYAARTQYESMYPQWDDGLERTLKTEWSGAKNAQSWDEVRPYVRRGFDAKHAK